MINKFNIIIIQQVYKQNQLMYTIRVLFNYSQSSTKSTNAHIHQFPQGLTQQLLNACNVVDSSRCMWYQRILEIILPLMNPHPRKSTRPPTYFVTP